MGSEQNHLPVYLSLCFNFVGPLSVKLNPTSEWCRVFRYSTDISGLRNLISAGQKPAPEQGNTNFNIFIPFFIPLTRWSFDNKLHLSITVIFKKGETGAGSRCSALSSCFPVLLRSTSSFPPFLLVKLFLRPGWRETCLGLTDRHLSILGEVHKAVGLMWHRVLPIFVLRSCLKRKSVCGPASSHEIVYTLRFPLGSSNGEQLEGEVLSLCTARGF